MLHLLRWWRALLAVGILWRRSTTPFVGTRKAIRLLELVRMLVAGHVGAWLLRWWWRESGAHLIERIVSKQPRKVSSMRAGGKRMGVDL